MSGRGAAVALAVSVVLAGPACGRSGEAPSRHPERCEIGLSVPEGFHATGGLEDPHPDHIGVRVDLLGERGRELHLFSGIPGDFGEGLPGAGRVVLRDGTEATLAGRGRTWVLAWSAAPPCTPVAVLGTGMGEREFRRLLADGGALDQG